MPNIRYTRHHSRAALVYAVEFPMTARLIKSIVVARQDVPSVVETLSAGTTVEFDLVDGITEVVSDGRSYLAMVKDLLEAAHPARWEQ